MTEPHTSVPAVSGPRGAEARVEIELDRATLALHGVETRTCVQCGSGLPKLNRSQVVRKRSVRGQEAVALRYRVCSACLADEMAVAEKVGRAQKVSNVFYMLQLGLFALSFGVGGGWAAVLLPVAVLLFLSTWAGASLYRRLSDNVSPRLISATADSVKLSVPRSWARVLADENPALLKKAPELTP